MIFYIPAGTPVAACTSLRETKSFLENKSSIYSLATIRAPTQQRSLNDILIFKVL